MTREKEAVLLEFCHRQRERFDEHAWVPFAPVSRRELATVAAYLAGVAWYGHQEDLGRALRRLLPTEEISFPELARTTRFDPSRFAGLLKARMNHARAS